MWFWGLGFRDNLGFLVSGFKVLGLGSGVFGLGLGKAPFKGSVGGFFKGSVEGSFRGSFKGPFKDSFQGDV